MMAWVNAHRPLQLISLRAYALLAVFISILFFAYCSKYPSPPFFGGDAEHYWRLGSTFFAQGQFSLLSGEQTFRGYLLPVVFGFMARLSAALSLDHFVIFYLFNAALTALSLTVVIPLLVRRLFGIRPPLWRVIVFVLLFFFFWRGYLLEPLSDTWSLFFVVLATLASIHSTDRGRPAAICLSIFSGIAMGAAVNIRPIYAICLPLYFIGLLILTRRNLRRSCLVLACSTVGVALPLFPQSLINHQFLGSWSPFVHSGSLYVLQLFSGIVLQRAECAYYIDPTGVLLLKNLGLDVLSSQADGSVLYNLDISQQSATSYVSAMVFSPLEAASIYTKHIVNGATLLGSNIYHCTPFHPRYFINIASMATLIVALAFVVQSPPKMIDRKLHGIAWLALVPVFFTIPTAMEGRFFFPLHLLAYGTLCFVVPYRRLGRLVFTRGRIVYPAGAAIFLLAVALLSNTFENTYAWQGITDAGIRLVPAPVLMDR